jgi:hypothetical protein
MIKNDKMIKMIPEMIKNEDDKKKMIKNGECNDNQNDKK